MFCAKSFDDLQAFQYESSYLSVFNIPSHFVEIKLELILVVCLALSGAAFIIFVVINFILMSWPDHPALKEKAFRILILLLFPL